MKNENIHIRYNEMTNREEIFVIYGNQKKQSD